MASPLALAPLLLAEDRLEQGHRFSGLGGEVARGFYYAGNPSSATTSSHLVERLAHWRIFANEAVEPEALDPEFYGHVRSTTLATLSDLFRLATGSARPTTSTYSNGCTAGLARTVLLPQSAVSSLTRCWTVGSSSLRLPSHPRTSVTRYCSAGLQIALIRPSPGSPSTQAFRRPGWVAAAHDARRCRHPDRTEGRPQGPTAPPPGPSTTARRRTCRLTRPRALACQPRLLRRPL